MKPATLTSAAPAMQPAKRLLKLPDDRWHVLEIAFWLMPFAAYFLFPRIGVLTA